MPHATSTEGWGWGHALGAPPQGSGWFHVDPTGWSMFNSVLIGCLVVAPIGLDAWSGLGVGMRVRSPLLPRRTEHWPLGRSSTHSAFLATASSALWVSLPRANPSAQRVIKGGVLVPHTPCVPHPYCPKVSQNNDCNPAGSGGSKHPWMLSALWHVR